jgi:hypothetical protein
MHGVFLIFIILREFIYTYMHRGRERIPTFSHKYLFTAFIQIFLINENYPTLFSSFATFGALNINSIDGPADVETEFHFSLHLRGCIHSHCSHN